MSNESTKRFEDWEEVNCNECARYWDSSCDGVNKDNRKPCNSFIATRSIIIPEQIEKLREDVKVLSVVSLLLVISTIILFLKCVL